MTGDDEEDNEDPEPDDDEDDEEAQDSMHNALEDADDNIGEALGNLDTAAMFADDAAKLTIKRAGSLLTMARELVTSCSDGGAPKSEPDDEETFGIPDLEPDEVDAIHDSLTEAERERCCESGNEAIASIDEALDFTGHHLASLDEDCEDGGYRDGVKAALEELKKARRLLARLLEDYPF